MVDQVLAEEQKLAALRAALPALSAGIYLDAATAGPMPAETAAALREADEWELRVGRGGFDRGAELEQREAEAKAVVAALIPDGDPGHILLTSGPRDALFRVASASIGRDRGEAIVASGCIDGASRTVAAARWRVRRVEPDAVPDALTDETRLVVVPLIHHITGERIDIESIIDANLSRAAPLVVDAGAAAGAIPLDASAVQEVSAILLSGDRWLLGPDGTGAAHLRGMPMAASLVEYESAGDRLPRRSLLGLARSVGWLEMYVGLPWVYERTAPLAASLARGLAGADGVELLTPLDRMGAIVTFRVGRWRAGQVAGELSHRIQAIVSIAEIGGGAPAIRASVGWWNTREEIDRFVDAVRLIARHTPDSLPRRPPLTMLPG
jgi:selenocysteine lyase/cysteine desulfurase